MADRLVTRKSVQPGGSVVTYKTWIGAAFIVVPAIAGLVGVLTGWGFRKGVRLRWRFACVAIMFLPLSLFNLLGAFVTSESPGEETLTYWLGHLPLPLLVSFWWIGICRLWGASVGRLVKCDRNGQ